MVDIQAKALVQRHVLPRYYLKVQSFGDYLREVAREVFHANAPPVSESLPSLSRGLIGVSTGADVDYTGFARLEEESHHQDQLSKQHLLNSRRSDLLIAGHRRDAITGAVFLAFPNTIPTAMVLSEEWQIVMKKIGVRRFYRMLLTTAYFAMIPESQDCFVQYWGEPISEKSQTPVHALPKSKRKLASQTSNSYQKRRRTELHPSCTTASKIYVHRTRMFSRSPVRVYRYGIVLGLPPFHVLNTQGSMHRRTACLARDMFQDAFEARNGKLGRWPKSLLKLRRILATMLRKHDRLNYAAVLESCCPSSLPRGRIDDPEDVLAVHPISAHLMHAPANTQSALSQDPARIQGLQRLAKSRSKAEPHFHRYATPLGQVCWFVRVALSHVFPLALFGSYKNRRVIVTAAKRLICARRNERISLHDILQGFKISKCAWLGSSQRKNHIQDDKRRKRLNQFLLWIMEQYVLPLLRTTFYATETAAFRQRVLYFRQDLWDRVSRPIVSQLRRRLFEPTSHAAGVPVAHVRLVPKDRSIRPIVNLRRRTNGVSINSQLQTAFDVLALEAARRPEVYGAAVHGANGIFAVLHQYKSRLMEQFGKVPMLYAVRADVRAAFDSLDHAELLRLVNALIPNDSHYIIQRYTQIKPGLGRIAKQHIRLARNDADYPAFPSLRTKARHAVLIDQVAYVLTNAKQVLSQIHSHVTQTLVRFGCNLYRQRNGVPQGSVLSTILCNLLLAEIERAAGLASDAGCLMRYTDDFLYLTPSLLDAQRFCRVLHTEPPKYGCTVAPEKTLVNFDMMIDSKLLTRVSATDAVPWCGFAICPTTLAVRADHDRYPYHFGDTLTVHRKMYRDELLHKMLHAVRSRTHALFTDTRLNCVRGAYANILEGFVVAAAKLHAYCRAIRPQTLTTSVIFNAIDQAVTMTFPMIASRSRLATSFHAEARCELKRKHVEWLGYWGFYGVLSRRAAFQAVSQHLEARLQSAKYTHERKHAGRWLVSAVTQYSSNIRSRC
ncbi:RNA-directed DNA polymerase [Malassezia yamatoensis]|uniref:Telomerase reverse transcriptase n=1 Tax=Malassezia yamatoensis TaxID=253288 RepID=A0AAJ5YW45_9BASI|nr:RNA-directed DNA polymerase [Malassezia yamatoensis]